MTIDERLEKLVERHEALTQTVELLAGIERRTEERIAENESRVTRLLDAMTRLVQIVESHEHRLDNLEGGR